MNELKRKALNVYFYGEDKGIYEALRKYSFETKKTMMSLVIQATKKELKKLKYL